MEILNYPNPVLRFKTESLKKVDKSIRTCAEEMIALMMAEKGIGLSANQVGLPFRMFIINWQGNKHCFINPEIRAYGKVKLSQEGCLSFPGIILRINRPTKCRFTAWTLDGNDVDEQVSGDLSRLLQHEQDHLDGILFIDRLNDNQYNDPRIKSFLLSMEKSWFNYSKDFDTDTFNELRYQYCGITRPVDSPARS